MEKENKKREQEHIKWQQKQLVLHRKARVKEEVSYADSHVVVTLRHITFNCDKSRAFKEGATMVEVYDCIGYLNILKKLIKKDHWFLQIWRPRVAFTT